MTEQFPHGEIDALNQERYAQSFSACAKNLITDPESRVIPLAGEVSSERQVIPSEFQRTLSRDVVADLSEGYYVTSAELQYIAPRKMDEGEVEEQSNLSLSVNIHLPEPGLTQRRLYTISRWEELELGIDWYETVVDTTFFRNGKRVSYNGIEHAKDAGPLTDEEKLREGMRHAEDHAAERRRMTDEEIIAFLDLIDRYATTRLSLE